MTPPSAQHYAGDERREGRSIGEVEEAFERKLMEHEMREAEQMRALLSELKSEAFPDGATQHRLAHQAMIDAAKAEAEFWKDLKTGMVKKSIWGVLQVLTILIIAGLGAKFGISTLWMTK